MDATERSTNYQEGLEPGSLSHLVVLVVLVYLKVRTTLPGAHPSRATRPLPGIVLGRTEHQAKPGTL